MIERLEVTPGAGTVIRYGGIVAWADPSASAALISFLAQSARNLSPSPRGGRQIADHIAGVLASRDPEPHVAFAVIGPSDHGWASLLHGPVQAWDGARWLAPTPAPGWLQAIITPRPAITVGTAGTPTPAPEPDAMWDLEAGVVPGSGFVLVPSGVPGRYATARPPVEDQLQEQREVTAPGAGPAMEPAQSTESEPESEPASDADAEPPVAPIVAVTTAFTAVQPDAAATTALPAVQPTGDTDAEPPVETAAAATTAMPAVQPTGDTDAEPPVETAAAATTALPAVQPTADTDAEPPVETAAAATTALPAVQPTTAPEPASGEKAAGVATGAAVGAAVGEESAPGARAETTGPEGRAAPAAAAEGAGAAAAVVGAAALGMAALRRHDRSAEHAGEGDGEQTQRGPAGGEPASGAGAALGAAAGAAAFAARPGGPDEPEQESLAETTAAEPEGEPPARAATAEPEREPLPETATHQPEAASVAKTAGDQPQPEPRSHTPEEPEPEPEPALLAAVSADPPVEADEPGTDEPVPAPALGGPEAERKPESPAAAVVTESDLAHQAAAAAVPTNGGSATADSQAGTDRGTPSAGETVPAGEPGPVAQPVESGVPAPASAPPSRRSLVPGPAGSVDLRTVATTAGAPLPRGGGPDQRIPGAPVVAGTLCARGHLNRPGLTVCARCRTLLPEAAKDQVSGTRPPLGVLVGDDGTVYRLDRGYVVGSAAGRDPTVGGGLARPLVLSGSDVSGSHAELRLADWDVLIVDRGSAAGTCVFEPGAPDWARLNPFEPRVLSPGTHVAFGQRVVTFLSPWVAQG